MKLRFIILGTSLLLSSPLIAGLISLFAGINEIPLVGVPMVSFVAFAGGFTFANGLRRRF